MEAIAKTKYLKGSPRKTRLVIDMIRGRNVAQAKAILKFTDKRAAQPIAKCLDSAIANAVHLAEQKNIAINPDEFWVTTCFVDMGPTKGRKRLRPAPQGRAYREQRHYCHITLEVSSVEPVKKTKKKAKSAEGVDEAKPVKAAPKSKKADAVKESKAPAAEVEKAEETTGGEE
jgi:large subunit ribosomal protein L22